MDVEGVDWLKGTYTSAYDLVQVFPICEVLGFSFSTVCAPNLQRSISAKFEYLRLARAAVLRAFDFGD